MSSPLPPGIYVPAVLFFKENEELDVEAIKAHAVRLGKGGITGVLAQGSNGEAQHLSHEERKTVIRIIRDALDANGLQNVIVLAGTGAQSTRETKKLNEDAKEAGATHALVLTPSTWASKMNKDAILKFHREVADASPIPTLIYNFPGVTAGIDLDSDLIGALAAHPNIVGTKLSCGNIGKLHRLVTATDPASFTVFTGRSDCLLQALLSGGAGATCATANILPKVHMRLYALWRDGQLADAMQLQGELAHADWIVSKLGGIGGIKAIVSTRFGYGEPWVRGPLASGNVDKLAGKDMARLDTLITLEKFL